jgi:DNA-binding protein H-NS
MTVSKSTIDNLSKVQLLKAEKLVEKALNSRKDHLFNDLNLLGEKEATEILSAVMATPIKGTNTTAKFKKGDEPLYRNPSNPKETWTGRGRHPSWVKEFVNGGGKLKDARV